MLPTYGRSGVTQCEECVAEVIDVCFWVYSRRKSLCVGMSVNSHKRTFTESESPSEHGQITEISPSDGCGATSVPSMMVWGYDLHTLEAIWQMSVK